MDLSRRSKWLLLGLPTACLVAGMGSCGYLASRYVDFPFAARELPAVYEQAEQMGLPLTAAALVPGPAPKDADNAALVLASIMGEKSPLVESQALRGAEKAAEAKDWEGLDRALRPLAPTLQKLEEATRRPAIDWKRDWDEGINLLFPEFAAMKGGVKLLGLRAQMRAGRGDLDGMTSDLERMRRLSRFAGAEPVLIGMLVEVACTAVTDRTIQLIAADDAQNPALLARLESFAEKPQERPSFLRAMHGEVFFGVNIARNLHLYGGVRDFIRMGSLNGSDEGYEPPPKPRPEQLVRDGMPSSVIQKAVMTRVLQYWIKVWPELEATAEAPVPSGDVLDREARGLDKERGFSYVLPKMLFPVFSQAGQSVARGTANGDLTVAYIRSLQYRQRTGGWPTDLAQIGFDRLDPFSGKPYRLVKKGEEFRIYSVGTDGKDDGGVTRSEGNRLRNPLAPDSPVPSEDVVVIYPPLPARN